ncbi:MAG: hypothetical protein EWV70_17490 [Microcystis flos-aquae Mf_QC_C_20070823_S20]|nr:MAG: hypothetical protein EWV70_17490 [Microcystis flos-aquae Mf_QC_C_20070823_S20]
MSGIVIPSVYQDFALLRWFIGSLGQEPQRDKGHKDRSPLYKLRECTFWANAVRPYIVDKIRYCRGAKLAPSDRLGYYSHASP